MFTASKYLKIILVTDALIFLLCITGLISIEKKADVPFTVLANDPYLTISKTDGTVNNLFPGDQLISINGFNASSLEKIEFITDQLNVGDEIQITLFGKTGLKNVKVKLTYFYSDFYIIATAIVAFFFFIIGLFVLLKKIELKAALIFHCASISISAMLCLTWANLNTFSFISQYISRIVLHIAYVSAPALFMHFTLTFPRDVTKRFKYPIRLNYVIAIVLAVAGIYYYINAILSPSDLSIENYLSIFNIIRIYLIAAVVLSITIFSIALYNEKEVIQKKQLKWLLFGFVVGPFSFVLLWVIPIIFSGRALIPEEIVMFLICTVPITFSIAIIKYHLLDIDEIINRGIVYSIVVALFLSFYAFIIWISITSFKIADQSTVSAIAAIILVLIFQPVKNKVQKFVDRKFFRVRYDLKNELNKFNSAIHNFNDTESLSRFLINEIDKIIPVDKIAYCEFDHQQNKLIIKHHKNFDLIADKTLNLNPATLEKRRFAVAAIKNKVENEVEISSLYQNTLLRWKINVVIPIKSVEDELYGFLLLGNKKSSSKYSIEDIDLLKSIGINTGTTIERIRLQEQVIREKLETERLEELNKQKSMFVSIVSHELKTPLTSIGIFTEFIKESEPSISEKTKNYLDIIEGETGRLTRLINNVLDFSKIERGVKEYSFRQTELNKIVKNTIELIKYQITIAGFKLQSEINENKFLICGDEDALTEAIENLISNSIRFSKDRKEIIIKTFEQNEFYCVSIKDYGIGIGQEELNSIFNQFYRSQNAIAKNIDGTGLGLPIVKHIIDAHKGKISVESKLNEGSTFTLCIPKLIKGDKDEQNFNY